MALTPREVLWAFLLTLFFATFLIFIFSKERKYDTFFLNQSTVRATWERYQNERWGFSVSVPSGYEVNERYQYSLLPGITIEGVSFTVPWEYTRGTNLSTDSKISIEFLAPNSVCSVRSFLGREVEEEIFTENGVSYRKGRVLGAAAGNLYEEIIYLLEGSKPCASVRYFLHSSNIGNYEPGTVSEFEREPLLSEFAAIRKTLKI